MSQDPGHACSIDMMSFRGCNFTAGLTCVERLEVLSFHQLGREKSLATGEPYLLENTRLPSPKLVERVKGQFAENGINVI